MWVSSKIQLLDRGRGGFPINRFMIGQYGTFDYRKFYRDFKEGFYGIEACLFRQEKDIANLMKEAGKSGFRVGVHFPLRAGISKLRDAQFLNLDEEISSQSLATIQQELNFLSALQPVYVLFHYPKPVILDDRVDWSPWRFEDRSEYEYESKYTFEVFKEKSEPLFEWLTDRGREYEFSPILEFDALNAYIYKDDYLEGLLKKYPSIKLCLDTARLFLQDRIDPFFDAKLVIQKYAKFTETVHLSNIQIADNHTIIKSRIPVLPNQHPNEGWAPIEEYLNIINKENKNVEIMFEHRSEYVSDEELEECYAWVAKLLN
ncbi:sugar phosphate isomerase/epimerase [Paenibacillus alba]|uniref:Sugar phosphate isomerase/epimerase n=1 Tax=Paenibacillus alba TaxID=1197127 RepID=A0ABU6FZW9_9BACL|nr:sugar phosphate isomerase/epimerase [Paenibacillus alba]MEC0227265.1 sugar phosphate isomerase/epimerase [Paenibacillus alba]